MCTVIHSIKANCMPVFIFALFVMLLIGHNANIGLCGLFGGQFTGIKTAAQT